MRKSRNQQGFGVVEVIVIVVILAIIGAGGWYVWQAQNKPTQSQSTTNETGGSTTPPKTTATFSDSRLPYTFEYQKAWTVKVDERLKDGQGLPDMYSVALLTPDVAFGEMPIGGSEVTKGAQVVVWASKTTLTNVQDIFTGIRAKVENKQSTTVAGMSAVEYEFGYESQLARHIDFIKDGWLYSISYASEGNERTSANYAAFGAVVTSFKFK
ncbi:MAG TPA: PsbP-related protein [Candidatus Saccharimonadales bacterium]|nr:PsbP-related protein [Candidatus Saccharimonadales bacterium]